MAAVVDAMAGANVGGLLPARSRPATTSLAHVGQRSLDSSQGLRFSSSAPVLPQIGGSSSSSPLFGNSIYSRKWAPEHKRFLHERRERHWLRRKAKHGYIDFSDSERAQLKRYFDALAEGSKTMSLEKLEDMLISLGLADDRKDVQEIVEALDGDCSETGQLDFEEYLEIVRGRTDSEIWPLFKAMMEGKLGDRNLNFQTVISSYRRHRVLDHMTSKVKRDPADGKVCTEEEFYKKYKNKLSTETIQQRWNLCPQDDPQKKGGEILYNFAELQNNRYAELEQRGKKDPQNVLNFESDSISAPIDGLQMVWRGVVTEKGLVSSRPSSAEGGRAARTVEPPQSPRSVVKSLLKVKINRSNLSTGRTIIVREAAIQDARGTS